MDVAACLGWFVVIIEKVCSILPAGYSSKFQQIGKPLQPVIKIGILLAQVGVLTAVSKLIQTQSMLANFFTKCQRSYAGDHKQIQLVFSHS